MDNMEHGSGMAQGKTTCACGTGCHCGCGNGMCGQGHRVIWWVVGIAILAFVFALGVKAGEFRDELHNAFGNSYRGYPMMQNHGYYDGGVAVPVDVQGSTTGTAGNGPMIPAPTPTNQ